MKLLILDVDGVLTSGRKLYDKDGKTIGKEFCDHDFTAIKKFTSNGFKVCWLSADTFNEGIAKSRDIEFVNSRNADGTITKDAWPQKLSAFHNISIGDMIYVGDDLFDIKISELIISHGGKAYCPANAVPQLKKVNGITELAKSGGDGVIMELYTLYFEDSSQPCG